MDKLHKTKIHLLWEKFKKKSQFFWTRFLNVAIETLFLNRRWFLCLQECSSADRIESYGSQRQQLQQKSTAMNSLQPFFTVFVIVSLVSGAFSTSGKLNLRLSLAIYNAVNHYTRFCLPVTYIYGYRRRSWQFYIQHGWHRCLRADHSFSSNAPFIIFLYLTEFITGIVSSSSSLVYDVTYIGRACMKCYTESILHFSNHSYRSSGVLEQRESSV